MKGLEKICVIIDKILDVITAIAIIFLTILIGWNVISRYVLNNPIAWQYEATVLCMPWVIFLGMSITARRDEHMRLTFVANAIPESVRNKFVAVLDIIVIVFLVYAGVQSFPVIKNGLQTMYQTIPVSRGWFYMPFPIGCFCAALELTNNVIKKIRNIPITIEENKDL